MTIVGKLYTIFCTEDDTFYIGSTVQRYLCSRMNQHRTRARDLTRGSRLYEHMRSIGIDKFYISLISVKEYPSREALVAREFQLIQKYKAIDPINCLNIEDTFGRRSPTTIAKQIVQCCKYVYTITFDDSSSIQTDNPKRYAKEHGYHNSAIFRVLSGKRKHHKNIVKIERVVKQ